MLTTAHNAPNWASILEGAVAEQASRTITAIADELRLMIDAPDQAAISGSPISGSLEGYAGMALFFAFKARSKAADDRDEACARACFERAIGEADELPPTLYRGFVGVAWMAAAFPELTGPPGVELMEHVDEVIEELIDWQTRVGVTWAFDLFNGLVGLGVYSRARAGSRGDAFIGGILELLKRRSYVIRGGLAWNSSARDLSATLVSKFPDGRTELGVAHGCAGVLGFAAAVHGSTSAPALAEEIARGAIHFLLALASDHPHAELPPVVSVADARPLLAPPGTPGPTSWCNGSFGIASVLRTATARYGSDAECAAAHEFARQMAAVAPPRAIEAGLCHGALGIAHMFARLFHDTADCIFRDAAIRWVRAAFAVQTPGIGIAGWQARDTDDVVRANPGFLVGASGMGLALLALATDVSPVWDQLLLLSN